MLALRVDRAIGLVLELWRVQAGEVMSLTVATVQTPRLWSVVDQRLGAVDALLLGDRPTDSYRIALTIVNGPDGPDIEARAVYPCRACGWAFSCGPSGEDCHT